MVESDAKATLKLLNPLLILYLGESQPYQPILLFGHFVANTLFFGGVRESQTKQTHVLVSWCLRQNLPSCFVQGSAPSPFLDVIYSKQIHVVFAT